MKLTVAAVVMMLFISALPLVQSLAAEVQIQGQIQAPREQSPAGGIGEVLVVVGSNILFLINVIYETLLGVLNALWTTFCAPVMASVAFALNAAYTTCVGALNALCTSICAPVMGIVGGLGGSLVGILSSCVSGLYTTFCAPLMGIFGGIIGSVVGMGSAACALIVAWFTDLIDTFVAVGLSAIGTLCGGVLSCITPIWAVIVSAIGNLLNACGTLIYAPVLDLIDATLGACWSLCTPLYMLICDTGVSIWSTCCVGGANALWNLVNTGWNFVNSLLALGCGGLWNLGNSVCGFTWSMVDLACATIVGLADFAYTSICGIWATCAGFDLLNFPIVQALSYGLSLFFWILSTIFGLCSISGIPCCGWCCIGPIGFAASTLAGIGVSMGLEILYFACRTCSVAPVI